MPERVVPTSLQLVMAALPALLLAGVLWLEPDLAGRLADGQALADLSVDAARLALLALAVTLALAGGGWDLATGAYAATATSQAMILQGLLLVPAVPAAAAGLLAAAALGACTGGLAAGLRRPAWLTSGVVLIVALAALSGLATAGLPPDSSRLTPALVGLPGLPETPVAMVAGLGLLVVLPALIRGSVLGNRFLALRAEPRFAHALGVPVAATRIALHATAALIAGLAGVLAALAPSPDLVAGATTDSTLALAAAVLGGGLGARFAVACVGAVVVAATLAAAQFVLPGWLLAAGLGPLLLAQLWLGRPARAAAGDGR